MIRDLEIRSITKDDLENVIELDNASFPEPWSKSLWNVELSRNKRIYLGAFQKKELVGFIGGLLAHTDFHITTVATKESIRNLGVGSVILFEMLHQILGLSAEVDSITLEVRSSNKPAQALYRKFGFAPVGLRRSYYQDNDEDAIIMSLENLQSANLQDRLAKIRKSFPLINFVGVQ